MSKKFYWLNEDSKTFLSRGYLQDGADPIERVKKISDAAEKYTKIKGLSDKIFDYASRGFYSFASPVWANFGENRALPVSCYGSVIDDSVESILYKNAEIGVMTKVGGGTSAHLGKLRARGNKISVGGESDGPVRFLELFDKTTSVISQGSTRRGAFAAYLPVDHPDILEYLRIKEIGHPIQELNFAVTIKDKWMQEMIDGDKDKRKIWSKIIERRYNSGYPYVIFIDNANNNKPSVYNDMEILASNVCSEIFLPSTPTESFVCVLSSINLLHYDEIRQTDAIECLIYLLDAVCEEFIKKGSKIAFMEHAVNFAKKHRALGLGVLGWHSLLQSKGIPFESFDAKMLNVDIFQTIQKKANDATKFLGKTLGCPNLTKDIGVRNATLTAVAPTTSSSFILGQVSPSIEPLNSNYFVKKLAKGNFTYKNPYLIQLLEKKGKNTEEIWKDILVRGGSVQHLNFLTDHEKSVFKTFGEISQKEIVIQASQRQKYIDQGQSLNIMIPPNVKPKEVSDLLIEGWKLGVKGFYYQRSANPAQELSRSILNCASCES